MPPGQQPIPACRPTVGSVSPPNSATFAIAGLIEGKEVALTNRAWRFNRDELARRYGFSHLGVLNDFEAIAWALPHLAASDVRMLEPSPRTAFSKRGRTSGVKV